MQLQQSMHFHLYKVSRPLAARASNKIIGPVEDKFLFEEQSITEAPQQRVTQTTADFFNYGTASFNEINLHKGEFLHNIGLRGQGMQIAMLDGGFFNYQTLDAMDSIKMNNQVLGTWDFVTSNTNVNDDHPHGMQCLIHDMCQYSRVIYRQSTQSKFLFIPNRRCRH